jgi:exosortase
MRVNSTQSALQRLCSPLTLLAVLVLSLVWAYGETLAELTQQWSSNPQHSHGYLVPVFAAALLWLRRDRACPSEWSGTAWGGLVLVGGLATWFVSTHFHITWLEGISFVPCLAGLALLVGGRRAWSWAWPSIGFLVFMVPLPYRAAVALTDPLQRTATIAATYALQTLGLPAVAEGNVILLSEVELGIVEACSGLRMLMIFFALSAGVALLIRRPLWERVLVLLSAAPIAIIVNVTRITVTGVLHEMVGSDLANAVFHDFAGWVMMPLALALLWLELRVLAHLIRDVPTTEALAPLGRATLKASVSLS